MQSARSESGGDAVFGEQDFFGIRQGTQTNSGGCARGETRVRTVVDDVSFTIECGQIFGLLGPNGGKFNVLIGFKNINWF